MLWQLKVRPLCLWRQQQVFQAKPWPLALVLQELAALLPLHLNQLTLNLLQLSYISGKGMAALTALLSLAGHCSKALRAHLDRWRCAAITLS